VALGFRKTKQAETRREQTVHQNVLITSSNHVIGNCLCHSVCKITGDRVSTKDGRYG